MPEQPSEDWFEEFRKLNQRGATAQGSPGTETSPTTGGASASKGSERRRHTRFEVETASTQLRKEGLLALFGVGKGNLARATIDLSEGGAQILIHDRLALGTRVRVKIAVEKYQDVIETKGVVRWCYQSARKKEDFFIGVQFGNLDTLQVRKLAAMREWFTSPQYKAVKQQRRADKPPDLIFPK